VGSRHSIDNPIVLLLLLFGDVAFLRRRRRRRASRDPERQVHGFTVLEDSGEMVAMTLILSYAVRLWQRRA